MVIKRQKRKESAVQPTQAPSETEVFEVTLRPKKLCEYIGQSAIKEHLIVHIEAAKKRGEPLGHAVLHGPPGLGKTTLANIIAREMGSQMRGTSGPAIEKPGDLASILSNLEEGDVLFIDEIHRMRPAIEEVLYSAMEDFALDLVIGKGPAARSMRLDLKPFTLVGATTKIGTISAPLRDRFTHNFKLNFYNDIEMEQIVERTAGILEVPLEEGAAYLLAKSCRSTPRIANRLVRSIRDFAQVRDETTVSKHRVETTLGKLGIDNKGLDHTDREILRTIIEKFAGGPVGLSTLAAATAEEADTLEDVYEPYLMQCGYLQRTAKGRTVTELGYKLLGITLNADAQRKLFQ
ncbi:MAG: Holliday junction branch migration DNA helicase RuvB [bacterium]|nr:Holliday junction branch migration DNA helicase RuvB [bacterium]MDA1292414.1 Holliday junction branch migration DNA helicase RuvB [bacterium]